MLRKFLSATWSHLLLANYRVDRDVLQPFVPAETRIDAFEGSVYASLVGFLFDRTRVLGIPVPFHRTFEEVNLRFYVVPDRDPSIRGVTFIKEIVPKSMITLIANGLFHEHYETLPMDHGIEGNRFWYSWGKENRHRMAATIDSELAYPASGSLGEFITEHYWGYAQGGAATLEYRVRHPQWKCCEVDHYEVDCDFEELYGESFEFLNSKQPDNVLYAEGSAVNVSFPRRLSNAAKQKANDS